MTSRAGRLAIVAVCVLGGALAAVAVQPASSAAVPALPRAQRTSAAQMDAVLAVANARLAANPGDAAAAVRAADVLLRQARFQRSAGPAIEAERVLRALLQRVPEEYSALKLLAAALLSQHRFREAIAVAERGVAIDPADSWHYGVLGDAHLELGDRARAFDYFDRMVRLRPDAAAYARVSYALELQGELERALEVMRMAAEATGAGDAEALAWHHVQIAALHDRLGDRPRASEALARALQTFPGYPDAVDGLSRLRTGLPVRQATPPAPAAAAAGPA